MVDTLTPLRFLLASYASLNPRDGDVGPF